jgi:hypothetical protein
MVKAFHRLRRAAVGVVQWVRGRAITETALPRLALSSWTSSLAPKEVRRTVMLTAFRNPTWIEWAVYAACQLRQRGVAATLVYSSSEIKKIYPLVRVAGVDQLGFWAGVETIPDIRLIDLDHWLPAPGQAEAYRDFARDMAPSVAAYDLRVEENESGPQASAYRRAVARSEEMLAETAAAMERILKVNPVSRLVCYSGLIGRSPAASEAARRAGVEVLAVEGWAWRPGHMVCNLDAPALEYNLRGWQRALGGWDEDREARTRSLLRFQEGALGDDEAPPERLHSVQRTSSAQPLPSHVARFRQRPGPTFLLATNVVGDSSTLRRKSLFLNQRDWLRQTIDFFRARPEWNLVVRAHPDEAFLKSRVVIRMGEVARQLAGDAPNVLVIDGHEDVSSYALMPGLAGGLVWISSIGVDMVARGVPVIAAARPKYHELSLVQEPASIDAYFEAVTRLAYGGASPTEEEQARAREYLNLVFSEFSFDAFSRSYRARDLFLEGPEGPPDADVFYAIVAGDLPPETPPRRETRVA